MASVFVLLEAFKRKEAAALGFFSCATASLKKEIQKALGLFAKIFDLICRQASGREGADRC